MSADGYDWSPGSGGSDQMRVSFLRGDLRSGLLHPTAVEGMLRRTSFGVLLDEGFPVSAVARVIRDTSLSVDGCREVLRGAPAEWVTAYEKGTES